MYIKVAMNLVFFINIIICKNFDTGIYRPTSLHVPSRLPRIGLHEVARFLVLIFILPRKSQLDISQEGVGSLENAK